MHPVTSGPLPANAITCFPAPGLRLGVGGNIASSRAKGRFEGKAVSDVTKLQAVRKLTHGETGEEDVIEEFRPALAGKTCRPSPGGEGDAATKRSHPEEVPAGTSVVDWVATCTPGDLKMSLCASGGPYSICPRAPIELAWMSAVGSAADGTAVQCDGRERRASRKQGFVHGRLRMSQERCCRGANMDIVTDNWRRISRRKRDVCID